MYIYTKEELTKSKINKSILDNNVYTHWIGIIV